MKMAASMPESESIVVTLSGRGDKDMEVVREYMNAQNR